MSLPEWAAARRRALLFLMLQWRCPVLAAFVLPVGLFPQVSFPARAGVRRGGRPAGASRWH